VNLHELPRQQELLQGRPVSDVVGQPGRGNNDYSEGDDSSDIKSDSQLGDSCDYKGLYYRAVLTCLGPWARQADGAPIIPMAHVERCGP